MDVDFALGVVFDPTLPSDIDDGNDVSLQNSGQNSSPTGTWNPTPLDETRTANAVCVWVDPFWTGITSSRVGTPVVFGHSADGGGLKKRTHSATRKIDPCVAVFRVRGRFGSIAPSTVQRLANTWNDYDAYESGTRQRSLVNSVKLHFFHVQQEKDTGEIRRDFLYSSAFPLRCLLNGEGGETVSNSNGGNGGGGTFGLFNYNLCDASSKPLQKLRLVVARIGTPSVLPPNTALIAVQGPAPDEHDRLMRLTDWIVDVLKRLCPDAQSDFCNMRTYCRDYQSTGLFQELHELFDTQGTSLPPTVAIYALYGALMVNGGVAPDYFVDVLLRSMLSVEGSGAAVRRARCLRIIRDLVVPFTLCAVEGLYWPDVSLGKGVEDQPFPLTFMPCERVFAKDDCEGRATQMQQMVILLRWMHKCAKRAGSIGALVAQTRNMASFAVLAPIDSLVPALVRACCLLGELLDNGLLDVQTMVGDVSFGNFQASQQQQQQKNQQQQPLLSAAMLEEHNSASVGHSFGLILFRGRGMRQKDACIVEATGWQRRRVEGYDRDMDAAEAAFYAALPAFFQKHGLKGAQLCGVMSTEAESRIYANLVLGKSCIYFTAEREHDEGEGGQDDAADGTRTMMMIRSQQKGLLASASSSSSLSSSSGATLTGGRGQRSLRPRYGAHVDALRQTLVRYPGTPEQPITAGGVFAISTRDFLLALCASQAAASSSSIASTPTPPATPSTTAAAAAAGTTTTVAVAKKKQDRPSPVVWEPQEGAEAMLNEYDRLHANLPFRRRCLRPPPKPEAEIEALMCEHWQPAAGIECLEEEWIGRGVAGIYFFIPKHALCSTSDSSSSSSSSSKKQLTIEKLTRRLRELWFQTHSRQKNKGGSDPVITCLPFMGSFIFNIRKAEPQQDPSSSPSLSASHHPPSPPSSSSSSSLKAVSSSSLHFASRMPASSF